MSQIIDDATSAMNATHDDASTLLDDDMPLGEFLDEQIARVRQHDIFESDDELETGNLETPTRTSPPRYELSKVPKGYTMSEETSRDILAYKDGDDLEKLLYKYKERSLNATMKCDPEFATSPIVIADKDMNSPSTPS